MTVQLKALLGDYPGTRALKQGEVSSPRATFGFAEVKTPNNAFKRVVRNLDFDVAELAIVTYLTARAHGKPLVLLPAVVRAKFQHESIICRADAPIGPKDLAGKRVGIRSNSVTTVAWVRGILQNDYGVDLAGVRWVTFEDAHVAELREPPGHERAAVGKEPLAMLLAGELDAAVLTGAALKDSRVAPVIPKPADAAKEWQTRHHGITPINHMVVVKASTLDANPWLGDEVVRLLAESHAKAKAPFPSGIEENRKSLEMIIKYSEQQGLIPRAYSVDELFAKA